jgi:hypothetical protein
MNAANLPAQRSFALFSGVYSGRGAGPRVDARVSSPRLHITTLALTDTSEPELDPSEAVRVVSSARPGLTRGVTLPFPCQYVLWSLKRLIRLHIFQQEKINLSFPCRQGKRGL